MAPYTRPYAGGFVDYPDTTTPLTAAVLNTIDVGVEDAFKQIQTLTTAQRTALTPSVGNIVYDSTLNELFIYANLTGGNAWAGIGNIVICTSTTRPLTPVAGQCVYETDTNQTLAYNGSAWKSLFDNDVWSFSTNGMTFTGATSTSGSPILVLRNTTADANAGIVRVQKSRTSGTTSSGDSLGVFSWQSHDGTSYAVFCLKKKISDGASSAGSTPGAIRFSTTPSASTTLVERMRITNAGVVFVGNGETAASPTASSIRGTGGSGTNIAGANISIYGGAGTGTGVGGNVSIYTALAGASGSSANTPTERVRVDQNGFLTLQSGALGRGAPVTKTGNFSLATNENYIICQGTATITVTLPTASAWTGREVTIKTIAAFTVVSASSNVVPATSATAGTAILAATAGKFATLVSDGTNWVIMASN